MQILVDSREQSPLKFKSDTITDVITTKLNVGDYGCKFKDGFSPPVFFERKALGDLFSTLTSGYKRFKKEILRAGETNTQLILIIEGTLSKVLNGTKYCRVEGKTIVKTIFTLWVKYNLIPVFCKDRTEMSRFITEYYEGLGRNAKR